jgi:hypothetical protein
MASRSFKTRVIAYRKSDGFIAVALDFDLLDEGGSLSESLCRLEKNINSYLIACLEDKETDEEIYRQSPKKYQQMYEMFQEWQQEKKWEDKMLGVQSFNSKQLVHG